MDKSIIRSKDLVQFWVDAEGWMGTASHEEPIPESSERISHLRLLKSNNDNFGDFLRCTFRIEAEYSQKNEITFGATIKLVHVPSELTVVGRRVVDDQFKREIVNSSGVIIDQLLTVVLRQSLQGEDDLAHKWTVLPRYKLRQEGEAVRVHDHIILRNAQYKDLAICSFIQDNSGEESLPNFIGMSLIHNVSQLPGIRIQKVQSCRSSIATPIPSNTGVATESGAEDDSAVVHGCDYLRIIHRQCAGHFICRVDDEDALKSTVAPFGTVNKRQILEKDRANGIFVRSFSNQQPTIKRDFNTSYSGLGLWQIIRTDGLQEKITYRDSVRLRHVISGQFLCIRPVETGDCTAVSNNVVFTSKMPESEVGEFGFANTNLLLPQGNQAIEETEEYDEEYNYNRYFKLTIERIEIRGLKLSDWLIEHEVYAHAEFKTELKQQTPPSKIVQQTVIWHLPRESKSPWVFHVSSNDKHENDAININVFVKNRFRNDKQLGHAQLRVEHFSNRNPASISDIAEGFLFDDSGNKLCSITAKMRVETIEEAVFTKVREELKLAEAAIHFDQDMDADSVSERSEINIYNTSSPKSKRMPIITSWAVATKTVPDNTCDFRLLALNEIVGARAETGYVCYGDNLLLETGQHNFRFRVSDLGDMLPETKGANASIFTSEKIHNSEKNKESQWWEYRGDYTVAPILEKEQKIADKDTLAFEIANREEVQDAWFASRLPPLARAATAVMQLTPTADQLFIPTLRHLKNALNTYSLWCLGMQSHDGLLLDDVQTFATGTEASGKWQEMIHDLSMDSDDDDDMDEDPDDKVPAERQRLGLTKSSSKSKLTPPQRLPLRRNSLASTPTPRDQQRRDSNSSEESMPSEMVDAAQSNVRQSAMAPWLCRAVGLSMPSSAKSSPFDRHTASRVHGFIEQESTTNATIIRRQFLLFEMRLMEQLLQFLNVCFLLERTITSLEKEDSADYPYIDPMLKQVCEAIQIFFHACVYQNEKNALKMISIYGSFLFLISQQIQGWHTPVDMVLRLACQGSDVTQGVDEEKSCLTRAIDVETSELENVLIHAISPSDLRQILEQMYQMHTNNHPSSTHLLSMLELLCKSSGKARKFFQAAMVRLLLPQNEDAAKSTNHDKLFGSVLFRLSYGEDLQWKVTFRSPEATPSTSMANIMMSSSLQNSLKHEADGIFRLFSTYDSSESGVEDNNLALQECYKLLEDLGFGGPCLYQEIGHLAGCRFWGFLQWWCFRASYFYPSTSISHYQLSPVQIMQLLDKTITKEDLIGEMDRHHIDRQSINAALPFNRMITSRISNFQLHFQVREGWNRHRGGIRSHRMVQGAFDRNVRAADLAKLVGQKLGANTMDFATALSVSTRESDWFRGSLRLIAALCHDGHSLAQRMVSSFLPAEALLDALSNPTISAEDKGLVCDLLTDIYVRNEYVFASRFLVTKGSIAVCGLHEQYKTDVDAEGLLFNRKSRLEFNVAPNHDAVFLRKSLQLFLQDAIPNLELYPQQLNDTDHLLFMNALLRLFHELLIRGFFCDENFHFFEDSILSLQLSEQQRQRQRSTTEEGMDIMTLDKCEIAFINKLTGIVLQHQSVLAPLRSERASSAASMVSKLEPALAWLDVASADSTKRTNFDSLDVSFPTFRRMFQDRTCTSILLRAVRILTDVRHIAQRIKMQAGWNVLSEAAQKYGLMSCNDRTIDINDLKHQPEVRTTVDVLLQRSPREEELVKALFVGTLSARPSVRKRSYAQLVTSMSEARHLEQLWNETEFRSTSHESHSLRLIYIKFEQICLCMEEVFQNDKFERKYLTHMVKHLSEDILTIIAQEITVVLDARSTSSKKRSFFKRRSNNSKNLLVREVSESAQAFKQIRTNIVRQHLYVGKIPCTPGEDDFFDLDLAKIRANKGLLDAYIGKCRRAQRENELKPSRVFAIGEGMEMYSLRLIDTIALFVKRQHIKDWLSLGDTLHRLFDQCFQFLSQLLVHYSMWADKWFPKVAPLLKTFFPHSTGAIQLVLQLLQFAGESIIGSEFVQFLQESLDDLPHVLSMEIALMITKANLSNERHPLLRAAGCRWVEHNLTGYLRDQCNAVEELISSDQSSTQSPQEGGSQENEEPLGARQASAVGSNSVDASISSRLLQLINVAYAYMIQCDVVISEETWQNMCSNFNEHFCRDVLESKLVSESAKTALVKLTVYLHDADVVVVEDYLLTQLRTLRTMSAICSEDIAAILGGNIRRFVFDAALPLALFRILDTQQMTPEIVEDYITAQCQLHRGQMASDKIEHAALLQVENAVTLRLQTLPPPSPSFFETSPYLPCEIVTVLMLSLILLTRDETLFELLSNEEKIDLIIVCAAMHLFFQVRADRIFDRAKADVIDMTYYEPVKEKLGELIKGLIMERVTSEAEKFATKYYESELQRVVLKALQRSYKVVDNNSFLSHFQFTSGRTQEKIAFVENLDVECIFSKSFMKTTPVYRFLQRCLSRASAFFSFGGELLTGDRKSAQVKSKAFIARFASYSDMDLYLEAEAIFIRNILGYLGDELQPGANEYALFHLICLLLDQNIDEIRNSPYLTLSQKLSRVKVERDRLRDAQNTMHRLGGIETVLKILGRSFTSRYTQTYIFEYTPLAMKFGHMLLAWQNKELQDAFVASTLQSMAILKPPEATCLAGYQQLIRLCAHEVSSFKAMQHRKMSPRNNSGKTKVPLTEVEKHQLRVLRACIQVFNLAGAACSGDNANAQRFIAGMLDVGSGNAGGANGGSSTSNAGGSSGSSSSGSSSTASSSGGTTINIAKDLCLLSHTLAMRLKETIIYIKNEQFVEKLAPLIYPAKDSSKRRFVAWHDPQTNVLEMSQYMYVLSGAFENLVSLCTAETTDEMLLAMPRVPGVLEFLGLMQLTATVKHPSGVGALGLPRYITWQGSDPVQFYATYLKEMNALKSQMLVSSEASNNNTDDNANSKTQIDLPSANSLNLDVDADAKHIISALQRWAEVLDRPNGTDPHRLTWNKRRDFRALFHISYDLFQSIVRKAEYNVLRLLLATLDFSTEEQAKQLTSTFNDGILIQNMDNLFRKIDRLNLGSRKDEATSTTVAYISLIEAIGIRFPETDDLLTNWDEDYNKRGIRPKSIYGSVELIGPDHRLRRLYFPVPNFVLQFWSYPEVQKTKNDIVMRVDRSSPEQKIGDFLQHMNRLYVVMKRQEFLKRLLTYPVHGVFGGKTLPLLQRYFPQQRFLGLLLTLGLNVYFVYMNTAPFSMPPRAYVYAYKDWSLRDIIVYSFQIAHFLLHASFALRTVVNSGAADELPSWLTCETNPVLRILQWIAQYPVSLLLVTWDSVWPLALVAMSYFAVTATYWLYVPCLLDILFQVDAMNVLYLAVSRNLFRVISTIMLAFLCLYFYSIIAYLFVQDQYDLNGYQGCTNPGSCFLLHIDYGLQNVPQWAGSSYIQPKLSLGSNIPYTTQIEYILGSFYNITYVVLINLVLQALISGLIIDSFSAMRDENEEKLRDIQDKCFICSIMRDELEESGVDYKTHIGEEHFMWDYFKFMIYLDLKDPLSFSSAENYAYRCMQDRQMFLQMMPINRSMTRETLVAQKQAAEDAAKKSGGLDISEAFLSLTHRLEELRANQSVLSRSLDNMQASVADQTTSLQRSQMHQLQLLHQQLTLQLQQVVSVITTTSNNTQSTINNNNNHGPGHSSRRASSTSMPIPPPIHT